MDNFLTKIKMNKNLLRDLQVKKLHLRRSIKKYKKLKSKEVEKIKIFSKAKYNAQKI